MGIACMHNTDAIGRDWFKAALTGDPNHRPRAFPGIPGTSETVDPFGSCASVKVLEQDKKTPKVAAVAFPPPCEHSKSWFLHLENRTAVAGRPEPEAILETSHIMRLSEKETKAQSG